MRPEAALAELIIGVGAEQMSDRPIDVRVFDPQVVRRESRAARRALAAQRRILPDLPARNFLGSIVCAALIVALHTAVLTSFLEGTGTRPDHREHAPFGAQAVTSDDGALEVSFIQEALPANPSATAHDLREPTLMRGSDRNLHHELAL